MFTWASKKLFGRADERHGEAASLDEAGHPREQLEVALPRPPPVFRDLLMPGHDEIPRRTRGEVADDGRLEVDAGGQAAMLAIRGIRRPAA